LNIKILLECARFGKNEKTSNPADYSFATRDKARRIGYTRIRGGTIPSIQVAQVLYASLGFKEISPYRNPIEGTVFIELTLV